MFIRFGTATAFFDPRLREHAAERTAPHVPLPPRLPARIASSCEMTSTSGPKFTVTSSEEQLRQARDRLLQYVSRPVMHSYIGPRSTDILQCQT